MSMNFLEHTADVKSRADGSNMEEMLKSAAEAMNETMRGEIKVLEQTEKTFETEGKDLEIFLHNFLEEFLYLLEGEGFLVSKIKSVEIDGLRVKCVVVGDLAEHYKFTNDVKAVTFNEMYIRPKGSDQVGGGREKSEIFQVGGGLGEAGEVEKSVDFSKEQGWECQVVLDV